MSVLPIRIRQNARRLPVALFLQGVQHRDAFEAGLRVAFVPVGMTLTAPLASIAIGQLPPEGRRAVYEGRRSQASPLDIRRFVSGRRIAFAVVAALCLPAVVLSLTTRRAVHRRRRSGGALSSIPPHTSRPP
ncbi:hypothetical protein GN316_02355 [Xylophilus sp. Kf1]|nr:hypothetical protein [Xylophilus sp. Kf1]